MSVDIGFYIQARVTEYGETKWKNIFLHKIDNFGVAEVAAIWQGSRFLTFMNHEHFGLNISIDEIKDLALKTGWLNENDDEDELPLYYAASLAKIKYYAIKPDMTPYDDEEEYEYIDKNQLFQGLVKEVEAYLTFAEYDWVDMDNVRVIGFVGY